MRRRNDAGRHVHATRGAEPDDDSLFQHTQQLRLCGQGKLADLVEEQRAFTRALERTLSRRVRARERAALVTEQLTLDELLGQRRAVHGDEWLLRSPTQAMNVPGNELLPGAALSDDEYRARDRRDAGDRVLELLHRGAGTPQRRVLRRITDRK